MQPRLLLIEDDPALQTLLVDVFSRAGYEVFTAMVDDYLYMVQEVDPVVMVLGCDGRGTFARGWEIAETLRREVPHLALVMLTTNSAAVAEVGITSRGMLFDAGLQKPFTVSELLASVNRVSQAERSPLP